MGRVKLRPQGAGSPGSPQGLSPGEPEEVSSGGWAKGLPLWERPPGSGHGQDEAWKSRERLGFRCVVLLPNLGVEVSVMS